MLAVSTRTSTRRRTWLVCMLWLAKALWTTLKTRSKVGTYRWFEVHPWGCHRWPFVINVILIRIICFHRVQLCQRRIRIADGTHDAVVFLRLKTHHTVFASTRFYIFMLFITHLTRFYFVYAEFDTDETQVHVLH